MLHMEIYWYSVNVFIRQIRVVSQLHIMLFIAVKYVSLVCIHLLSGSLYHNHIIFMIEDVYLHQPVSDWIKCYMCMFHAVPKQEEFRWNSPGGLIERYKGLSWPNSLFNLAN